MKKTKNQFLQLAQGLNAQPAQEDEPAKKAKAPALSSPDQEEIQISAFIPKSLHKRVKIALASQDEKLTLTELLTRLLSDWTDAQK